MRVNDFIPYLVWFAIQHDAIFLSAVQDLVESNPMSVV